MRQDSGDPFKFIGLAKSAYEGMGVDPKKKVIVFSDSLDIEKCLALKKACDEAGIPGTSFKGCGFVGALMNMITDASPSW